MDLLRAATELFRSPSRTFPVELWDGSVLPPARDAGVSGRVALRRPEALSALLPPSSELRTAEAILDGDIELEGDPIAVLEAAARWVGPRLPAPQLAALLPVLIRRVISTGLAAPGPGATRLDGRLHSPGRDRAAVRHHYDLSEDFYRLFLDAELVYSCAYFTDEDTTLEDAQRAKLELVCRKLALAPGDRLLDVGCGWGALLEHAAARHGVEAVGITLSANQLAEAKRRLAARAGPAQASAIAADYRLFRPDRPFTKVASVGMMEHVGRARLDEYFLAVDRLLEPGGLFLNHAIAELSADVNTFSWLSRRQGGFIQDYIFPDYELVPIAEVIAAAERARFEVRDVESLREHYAETLRRWSVRLEARFGEAVALVGARRARAYRLYLASSAVAFRLGRISVFQLLLRKRGEAGHVASAPRCRAAWYRGGLGASTAEPQARG